MWLDVGAVRQQGRIHPEEPLGGDFPFKGHPFARERVWIVVGLVPVAAVDVAGLDRRFPLPDHSRGNVLGGVGVLSLRIRIAPSDGRAAIAGISHDAEGY